MMTQFNGDNSTRGKDSESMSPNPDLPNPIHVEVIRELKDQGLHVMPVVKKAAIMKNWQNEIFTGEITGENFGVRMGDNFTIWIDVDDISLLPYFEYLKDNTYMVKSGD